MNVGDLGENAYRLSQTVATLPPDWTLCDCGVRAGVSSDILLAHGHKVIGIDVNACPPHLVDHPRYRFIQSDSVTALADLREPIGLLFLDTLHIAEQVMAELYFGWEKIPVGGWVVAHDTNWPEWKKDYYFDKLWERPEWGLSQFFSHETIPDQFHDSVRVSMFPESHGMWFIQKLAYCDLRGGIDWGPVFAARNELLALVPEGVAKREITPSIT